MRYFLNLKEMRIWMYLLYVFPILVTPSKIRNQGRGLDGQGPSFKVKKVQKIRTFTLYCCDFLKKVHFLGLRPPPIGKRS